jgi:hypothetical protein
MKPEMAVRKAVHAMGYRYRLHWKDMPGKLDLVFTSRRKVIFRARLFLAPVIVVKADFRDQMLAISGQSLNGTFGETQRT